MKKVKKIIFVITITFLSLLMLFNVYNIINLKILKHDLTSIHGYAILEVVSRSMEPTINKGDLIVIKTKDFDYKEEDIVTFYDTDESFVTHRIKTLKDDEMITKGDNNNTEDESSKTSKIVGKYLFRIKGIGNFLQALKNPIVSILIFVIGLLLCYFVSMEKEEQEELEQDKIYQKFLKEKERKLKKARKEDTKPRKKNTKQEYRKKQKKKRKNKITKNKKKRR